MIAFLAGPSFHEGKGSVWARTGEIVNMTNAIIANIASKPVFLFMRSLLFFLYDHLIVKDYVFPPPVVQMHRASIGFSTS